jgi:hypothetical protein
LSIADCRLKISNRQSAIGNLMMPPYPIYCYRAACERLAEYKIAARWSDGVTEELKTYALSCGECLAQWFHTARAKQVACRLAAGEVLETPGIYHLERGQRDQHLHRLEDLERQLLAEGKK